MQGRFTSPDPLHSSASPTDPQSWNRYSYVGNRPLLFIDPSGLDWWYATGDTTRRPEWFDKDPGEGYERWTSVSSYVYFSNESGKWWALDPLSNTAQYFDTQEAAQSGFNSYHGEPLLPAGLTLADMDFAAGFAAAFGGFAAELAAARNGVTDTTSRDYQAGMDAGMAMGISMGVGGAFWQKYSSRMVTVTSWADEGITPDLNPGRWVQLGGPTRTNFWLTGLPGGKAYVQPKWPFLRYDPSRVPFENYITSQVPASSLQWPKGWEKWKGILGQRQIKGQ